jgi:carboxylesterase
MKIAAPKPFIYKGGNKAVLLLHGFTGTTGDVRKLGKYLQERGYTCHAPLYKGHGVDPYQLIHTNPVDWWQDVINGYQLLRDEGYEKIAVAGVSLGGVLSLKLSTELPVQAVISMCAPMHAKTWDDLYTRVTNYALVYKKLEGKNENQIQYEMGEFKQSQMPSLVDLQELIVNMKEELDKITAPIFVIQGRLDDPLYQESAQIIYDRVHSEDKQLKWYEHSGHIITLGKEKETVYEDIYRYLETLNW